MERLILLLVILALLCSTGNAEEFAVVHNDARTTPGTQSFTSSGFGTPVAAMCMASYGATNGTSTAHAGFTIGFTDGTRQNTAFMRSKNGVTTTLTGKRADTSDVLYLADQDGATILRAQFSSWTTDGMVLNYSVAPATAYKVTCTLIGGVGISNAYTNIVSTPATVDTSTTVSTVGFQADVLIGVVNGDGVYNDTNQAQGDLSIGFAVRGSTQKALGILDVTAVTTTSLNQRNFSSRIGRSGTNSQQIEIQNFTSLGFDATTRNTSTAATMGYLALKFNGIAATGLAIDSPTATGSQSITGITGTPQWGLLIAGSAQSLDVNVTDTDSEAFGVSTFTSTAQRCFAISSDDAVTTSNVDTLTDTKPICLIKDDAAFYNASFTSFSDSTATFNYGTANGTTRKWIGLFVGHVSAATSHRRGVVLLP